MYSRGRKMGDLFPQMHGGCSQLAMVLRWYVVSGYVEEVGDRIMDRDEALQLP